MLFVIAQDIFTTSDSHAAFLAASHVELGVLSAAGWRFAATGRVLVRGMTERVEGTNERVCRS